jgi:hypothetical protein
MRALYQGDYHINLPVAVANESSNQVVGQELADSSMSMRQRLNPLRLIPGWMSYQTPPNPQILD